MLRSTLILFLILGTPLTALADVKIRSRADWKAQMPLSQKQIEKAAEKSRRDDPENKYVRKAKREGRTLRYNIERDLPARKDAIYLTIHHTGLILPGQNLDEKLRAFQKSAFSYYLDQEPNLFLHAMARDVPYHFVVARDGQIAEGRELKYGVFTNTGYKLPPASDGTKPVARHITVVLEGDFNKQELVGTQRRSLVELLGKLSREHSIPPERLTYHKLVADKGTPCPGSNIIDDFENLRAELGRELQR